ncbi:MAG: hypothetical protein H0U00_01270 [Actinobacteria bacterium]|nr:hypothetical protein [Actinomycetota bacterium]
MSIREQQTEVEQDGAAELDAALAATDSALRQLDVAQGREKYLRQQVDKLESRLLEKEEELTNFQRELKRRSEIVGELQSTFSWRVTRPLRAVRRFLARP